SRGWRRGTATPGVSAASTACCGGAPPPRDSATGFASMRSRVRATPSCWRATPHASRLPARTRSGRSGRSSSVPPRGRYVEPMPAYQTVLFDLDGTLIDSVDLIVDSYLHTFRSHGLPESSREQILAGLGRPLRSIFAQWTEDPGTMDAWIA